MNISRYFPYCKVLWMAVFFQLFEIFIVICMFDCSRARKYGLLWEKRQYWPLRSHFSEEWPQNTRRVLFELGTKQSKAQAKDLKKLSWRVEDLTRTHSENKYVMSVWSCVHGHFTAKPYWSRVEFVQVLSWITFCPWLGSTDLRGSSLSFENRGFSWFLGARWDLYWVGPT